MLRSPRSNPWLNTGLSLVCLLAMLAASDGTAHAQVTFGVYQPLGSHASIDSR